MADKKTTIGKETLGGKTKQREELQQRTRRSVFEGPLGDPYENCHGLTLASMCHNSVDHELKSTAHRIVCGP